MNNMPQYNNFVLKNNKNTWQPKKEAETDTIIIITSKYIINFTNEIKEYLSMYFSQIYVKVVDNTPIEDQLFKNVINKSAYLLVIGVTNIKNYNLLKHVSNNIAIIQTEQLNILDKTFGSGKNQYIEFFNSFPYLYDYNVDNKEFLKNNTRIINPPINYYVYISEKKEIDVLFIGSLNHRRDKILKELSKKNIKLEVISNKFGNELHSYIKKSKVIINIHIDKDSIFEIFRIHEILPYNTHIISESINNSETVDKYKDFVDFVPIINDNLDNIDNLKNSIEKKLKMDYKKPTSLEKFIFKNNIEFYKELEYISRKIFNKQTNINVDPTLINNSEEHKNVVKINDKINSQLILLNHITQKINNFNKNSEFEKDINKNLFNELDKTKHLLDDVKAKKKKLEEETKIENNKVKELNQSIKHNNNEINIHEDKINNLQNEHSKIEERESIIINKQNSILHNKNSLDKIVKNNQIMLNTYTNDHNDAINLAIDIQANSFEFIKECEQQAKNNLEKAKEKRKQLETAIYRSKKQNINNTNIEPLDSI